METKIISQEKNPFLQRDEIILNIKSDSTPRIDEIKKEIGREDELVVVKRVNSNFGRKEFIADIFVYDNLGAKEKIEVIPKKVRKKMEEEKKAAEETVKKEAEAKKVADDATKKGDAQTGTSKIEEKAKEIAKEEVKE